MVKVFINQQKYEFELDTQTGAQIIEKAGFDPTKYDLFGVKNGKSDPIAADQTVQLKDGDHFRVLPKDLTLGCC